MFCVGGCGSTEQKTETVQEKSTPKVKQEKQPSKAEDAKMHFGRGRIWFNMGEYDDAIEELTKAIKLNSELAESYDLRGKSWPKNRGSEFYNKEDFEKAIDVYNNVNLLNVELIVMYHIRGEAWAKKGDKEKAEADFKKAKELGSKEGSSIQKPRPTMHKIPLH